MDLGLKNKKVILSGGSRGLGKATLKIFADEGCDLAFFSRDAGQVAEAAAEFRKSGGAVYGDALDISDATAYRDWLESAVERLGGCDIFVHNVSSSGAGGTGDWQMTFDYDIKAAVTACELLEPFLAESGSGAVILMSSTAAVETFLVPQAFNALKAALITYGKQLSQAWGAKGIRVNMVSPGPTYFEGGNWSKIKAAMPELFEKTAADCALGRLGEADEIARTVVFLSSPASSYTTGTNVIIDGGYTKRVQF